MQSTETLSKEIAGLGDLPRSELAERWQSIYGVAPPKGARRVLLERAIAWHLQAAALGAPPASTERILRRAIGAERKKAVIDRSSDEGSSYGSPSGSKTNVAAPRALPSNGTRLIREWRGKTHIVDVIESGFVWEDNAYRSLSVIAKAITGAHWSGPRFYDKQPTLSLCDLHQEIVRGGSRAGLQLARCTTRSL